MLVNRVLIALYLPCTAKLFLILLLIIIIIIIIIITKVSFDFFAAAIIL